MKLQGTETVLPQCVLHTMYVWYLNENDPHRLTGFGPWSPVSGTVWEGVGGVASLEYKNIWALSFQKPTPGPLSSSLRLLSADQDMKLSATASVSCLPASC